MITLWFHEMEKSLEYYVKRIIEVDLAKKEDATTFMRRAGFSKVGSSVFVFPEEDNMFTHCHECAVINFDNVLLSPHLQLQEERMIVCDIIFLFEYYQSGFIDQPYHHYVCRNCGL